MAARCSVGRVLNYEEEAGGDGQMTAPWNVNVSRGRVEAHTYKRTKKKMPLESAAPVAVQRAHPCTF